MPRPRSKSLAGDRGPSPGPAGEPPLWLSLRYLPVTPFSLRPSLSTSAGGKTLLLPTPYAIKIALVDAHIRGNGIAAGEALFEELKTAAVAVLPPSRACVTNTFVRSLKLWRRGKKDEEDEGDGSAENARPFDSTLRYREICIFSGALVIAIGLRSPPLGPVAEAAARCVNYFGKRGSFFQLEGLTVTPNIDERAVVVDPLGWSPTVTYAGDVACHMDDLGPEATLARVSPFSDEAASWNRDRTTQLRILPMRRVTSASTYTMYERLGG